jgi:hypothetical protein
VTAAGEPSAPQLFGIPDDAGQKEHQTYIGATFRQQTTERWHNLIGSSGGASIGAGIGLFAVVLNVALALSAFWIWKSSRPTPSSTSVVEHPPMEGFTALLPEVGTWATQMPRAGGVEIYAFESRTPLLKEAEASRFHKGLVQNRHHGDHDVAA